jgi:hypothetical protein
VPLLLFASPVSTHSIHSPKKKKWLLSAGFECAKGVVHVVEMACIFADCSITVNQQNKFALTINACWQNFFCGMCVTPANNVEEHLQHLAGCIGHLILKS